MVLHFNVKGENRKAMVKAIEEVTGIKARYLGVPSFAYEIGSYIVGKNGELESANDQENEETSKIIKACIRASGAFPEELDYNTMSEENAPQSQSVGLTVVIPIEKTKVENLKTLIDSKKNLIKKALGIQDVTIEIDEDKVSFPWFSEDLDAESVNIYTRFIAALCKMSVDQKRIQAKEKNVDNEKYAFRCFLLRLGFIGTEFKKDRKILLKNLEGSSAFKSGTKGGEE